MQTKKEQCLQLKAEGKTHEQIALIVWGKRKAPKVMLVTILIQKLKKS